MMAEIPPDFVRIGLMRHFRVQEPLPSGWRTAGQLHQWRQTYEASDVIPGPVDVGATPWLKCLSSDLRRAYLTAQAAHAGLITQTPLLREMEAHPFRTGGLRLPIWIWRWILHVSWATSHESQRAARDDFRQRMQAAADLLEAEQDDTLVVSHAGTMMYLRKELLRRGFRGPKFGIAEHARTYVFERNGTKRL
jgi:broad specificity phosphatase PhoE